MELEQALGLFDPHDDNQWTVDGLPKLDVLAKMIGRVPKRQEVTDANPELTRSNLLAQLSGTNTPLEEDEQSEIVEQPLKVTQEEVIKGLQYQETELTELLQRKREAIQDEQNEIVKIESDLTVVQGKLENLIPKQSNGEAIRNYINTQNETRAKKAAHAAEVAKHVDLKSLQVKSPLDRSMARNTSRGSKRPVIPARNQ